LLLLSLSSSSSSSSLLSPLCRIFTKGCQRREYQNELWNEYHGSEGKEDVQGKRGWKEYKQP
jgi:hypothetical protein